MTDTEVATLGVTTEVRFQPSVSAVLWQNSVPVLCDLTLRNLGEKTLPMVQLQMVSEPPALRPRIWTLQQVAPGQIRSILDLSVDMDGAFLSALTEACQCTVTLSATSGDAVLAVQTIDLRLLPVNHWGGVVGLPDLLAAYVTPNDPAVAVVVRKASDLLRAQGLLDTLEGYQGGDKQRVWQQAAAIWSAVCNLDIRYINPPPSFEQTGQRIRLPSQIVEERLATCLDTATFFAACLEQIGLHPVLVLTHGHAHAGVWLIKEDFGNSVMVDAAGLRNRMKLDDLLLFETTLCTQTIKPGFKAAQAAGAAHLTADKDEDFECVIDISRARQRKIRPLPSVVVGPAGDDRPADAGPASPLIEDAPSMRPGLDINFLPAEGAPVSRLERWRQRLLDLSGRNRLLNLPATSKQVLPIVAGDVARLEEVLSRLRGQERASPLRFVPSPRLMRGEDPRRAGYQGGAEADEAERTFAVEALTRNELVADHDDPLMQASLLEIYRAARNAQQEGGTNTLFLTIGSLLWRRQDREKPYRAPLVLIPVTLERQSVRSGFTLRTHEDETRINDTLLEMLRQDFNVHLPPLMAASATDGGGLDVLAILDTIRSKLRHIPGWEVADEISLTNLSFTKYLMWKDLIDRAEALQTNAVVRRLIAEPSDIEAVFDQPTSPGHESDADRGATNLELICPLEADSSQAQAVSIAASGRSFVMIGPPGTGKSQTIANIIANTLAQGRTVLFVAEKRAALEVVQRRLKEVGLSDFCLDLFSSKASKHAVLQQLDRARSAQEDFEEAQWLASGATIETLTAELNGYVQALHKRGRNGLSAFKAMSTVLLAEDQQLPRLGLQWPRVDQHDIGDLQRLLEFTSEAEATWRRTGDDISASRLAGVQLLEWSPPAEHRLLEAARVAASRLESLRAATMAACESLGLEPTDHTSAQALVALGSLFQLLLSAPAMDAGWALSGDAELALDALREAEQLTARHTTLLQEMENDWKPGIFSLNLHEIKTQWQDAMTKWALPRTLALARLRKLLAAEVNGPLSDQCAADLARLTEVEAIKTALQGLNLARVLGLRWKDIKTDFGRLNAGYAWSRQIRAAQAACATNPLSLTALRERVRLLVLDASELLEPNAATGRTLLAFIEARSQATAALEALIPLSGANAAELIPITEPNWAGQLATVLVGWTESIRALKDWSSWLRIKRAGETLGLEKLLLALEQGLIDPALSVRVLEADYARWWVGLVVEATPQLRNFVAATHEKRIERFRDVDKSMLGLASRLVRLRLSRDTQRDGAQRGDKEHLLLNHELQKRARHLPVRQLMDRMPKLMRQLTPCLMMSPLSVAQFLPANADGVDLVIFDEASQIATWDAVGAIGRGAQVVVVGDPKQLPPTDFFQRQGTEGLDVDGSSDQQDLESVLDECIARGLPTVQLNWHYRSRHESLIAFSNQAYYGSRLITFPSPTTDDRAVSLRYVQNGVYAKGGARTNIAEAQEIVAETIRQLQRTLAGTSKRSIGIVTFNAAQQDLIENLLEDARRKNPALEAFFAEDEGEAVMIKSLESVQGEERDVMLFSLTYGPDAAGKIAMNFGPLNNNGGERRLNVAVTRAREQLIVFSSLRAEQIDLARTSAQGVRDLKRFLAYAEHGARAMTAVDDGSVGDFDSGFEEAVSGRLSRLGWDVRPQIGVSGFRIDLGVVDPDAVGRFLAGVECDGATYHRSATARDRDRLRQTVLEGLGWKILRIWSTDWWTNPERETSRLHAALTEILDNSRSQRATEGPQIVVDDVATTEIGSSFEITPIEQPVVDPARFYDHDYQPQLQAMILGLLHAQGPTREDVLSTAIARAHGFQRTGVEIRGRVLAAVRDRCVIVDEAVGKFIWPADEDPSRSASFRPPAPGQSRDPTEVPMQELVTLALEHAVRGLEDEEALIAMRNSCGMARMGDRSRSRCQEALALARKAAGVSNEQGGLL